MLFMDHSLVGPELKTSRPDGGLVGAVSIILAAERWWVRWVRIILSFVYHSDVCFFNI